MIEYRWTKKYSPSEIVFQLRNCSTSWDTGVESSERLEWKLQPFHPFHSSCIPRALSNVTRLRQPRDSQQFSTLQPTSWAFDYITYANLVLMVHLSRPNGVRRSQAKGKPWSISRNDNVAQIASHGHFFSSIMREISRIPCLFVCISRRACRETERTRRFDWVIWESFSRCKVYIYVVWRFE